MREYFRDIRTFQRKHWKKSLFFGLTLGLLEVWAKNSTKRV